MFDYLPSTIESYLKLPAAYATMHPIAHGKTPKAILLEQLTLIDDSLKKINHSLFAEDAQALLANQRFLQQRLERGDTFL